MKYIPVARLLAYISGMVNRQLLLQNEYLVAENKILRSLLPARVPLTDSQRATLAEIGKRLGRQGLEPVAGAAKPDTILGWYRKLIARKFDAPNTGLAPGDRRSDENSPNWSSAWLARTAAGDTIALPEP